MLFDVMWPGDVCDQLQKMNGFIQNDWTHAPGSVWNPKEVSEHERKVWVGLFIAASLHGGIKLWDSSKRIGTVNYSDKMPKYR